MGLQVRLRHTLGERLLDLPDRPVEKPLVVGRAREADLKVPSVSVAPEHCALFVHEGQWVLQDMSNGLTFVNGSALEGPTPLCVGDVIVLGADASPATVEVDPAGAAQGRTGEPARTEEPAPAPARTRTSAAPRAQAGQPYRPAPAARVAPAAPRPLAAPPVVQDDDPWGTQPAAENDPFADWQQPAASGESAAPTPTRRRKPKKSSDTGLYVGIAACVLIIGGTGWFAYQRFYAPPPAPPAAPTTVWKKAKGPNDNIFTGDSGDTAVPAPAATHAPPAPVSPPARNEPEPPPPPPPPPAAAVDNDPHKGDLAWEDVQGALVLQNYAQAVIKCDDYRRNHTGASAKEISGVIDEAMDGLWWKRIKMLYDKKEAAAKKIRAIDKDIKEEPNPKFREQLTKEKQPILEEIKQADDHLNSEMGYTATQSPDTTSKEMMSRLGSDRDASKFGAWKVRTLKYIRDNHGKTPWEGE